MPSNPYLRRMATDKNKLMAGVRFMAIGFPFIFMGPGLMFLVGIPKLREDIYWPLAISLLLMGTAVYFCLRGLRTILSAFFDGNKES
jgi:hypothetical protein